MRVGLEHDLFLYGLEYAGLPRELQALVAGPCVVSCPGRAQCSRGVADSCEAERRTRGLLSHHGEVSLCISGCPNNCVHAAVADVGLVGSVRTVNGRRTEGFRLLAGGGNGSSPALAHEICPFFPAEKVAGVLHNLLARYECATAQAGCSLAEFISTHKGKLSRELSAGMGP
jgi:sulfite reductase beta subunit-like hemoprotein